MSALAIVSAPQPLDALVESVVSTLRSQHSRRAYGAALRRFLSWAGERLLPFSRDAVRAYIAYLQGAGASPATINLALAAIRSMAQESLDSGAVPQSTATAIIAVHGVPRQPRKNGRWLTRDEARRLADAPDNARDKALLALLLGAGLRRAEVLSLTRVQVQQLGGRVVLADVCRKRGKYQTVVLSDWVAKRLEEWLNGTRLHASALNNCGSIGGDRDVSNEHQHTVSEDRAGARIFDLSASGIVYLVEHWSKAAGVKISPHDLRRTFAGLCLDGGAEMRSIQEALGHSSIQTTERYLGAINALKSPACDKVQL